MKKKTMYVYIFLMNKIKRKLEKKGEK
jgi:hypothetical protein